MTSVFACYYDGPTLSASTAIYTDIALTVLAPDGFYAEGGIVREQDGGVLQPQSNCNCGISILLCYTNISVADACCNCEITPP